MGGSHAGNAPAGVLGQSITGAFVVPGPYPGRMDMVELRVACPHCGAYVPCVLPVIRGTHIAVVGGAGLVELHAHMWADHVDAEVH